MPSHRSGNLYVSPWRLYWAFFKLQDGRPLTKSHFSKQLQTALQAIGFPYQNFAIYNTDFVYYILMVMPFDAITNISY